MSEISSGKKPQGARSASVCEDDQMDSKKRDQKNLLRFRVPNNVQEKATAAARAQSAPGTLKKSPPSSPPEDVFGEILALTTPPVTPEKRHSSMANGNPTVDAAPVTTNEPSSATNDVGSESGAIPASHLESNIHSQHKIWMKMLNTLRSDVDQLYHICEYIENAESCREVLTILQTGVHDFKELIRRFTNIKQYEKASKHHGYGTVAWGVRKSYSPTKNNRVTAWGNTEDTRKKKSLLNDFERMGSNLVEFKKAMEALTVSAQPQVSEAAKLILPPSATTASSTVQPTYASAVSATAIASSIPATQQLVSKSQPSKRWSDMMDDLSPPTSPMVSPLRTPSRSVHDRLSSPENAKRATPDDVRRKSIEKQAKAEWNRAIKEHERQGKLKQYAEKIRDANKEQQKKIDEKKSRVEERLDRADQLHEAHLQKISTQARMQNKKVEEVGFIQTLTAETNKQQIQKKLEESEARREQRWEDIKRKKKELSKEEAVLERKRALEAERLSRLQEREEARKEKEQRISKERDQALAEREAKAEEHASKVERYNRTKQKEIETKEKKLSEKLIKSAVRKNENLEKIREKASADLSKVRDVVNRKQGQDEVLASGTVTHATTTPFITTNSEGSQSPLKPAKKNAASPKHSNEPKTATALATATTSNETTTSAQSESSSEATSKVANDSMERSASADALTNSVKPSSPSVLQSDRDRGITASAVTVLPTVDNDRLQRIHQRLVVHISDNNNSSAIVDQPTKPERPTSAKGNSSARIQRILRDLKESIEKHSAANKQRHDEKPASITVPLQELIKIIDGKRPQDLHFTRQDGGLDILVSICTLTNNNPPTTAQTRYIKTACNLLANLCALRENAVYLVKTHKIQVLITMLIAAFARDDHYVPHLLQTISLAILSSPYAAPLNSPTSLGIQIKNDLIEYILCSGAINAMHERLVRVKAPLDATSHVPNVIYRSLQLIDTLTAFPEANMLEKPMYTATPAMVEATVLEAIKDSNLVWLMFSMLATLLLHSGPPRGSQFPPLLSLHVVNIALVAVKVLNNIARLDLGYFQGVIGSECCTELFHVFSFLLGYCCTHLESSQSFDWQQQQQHHTSTSMSLASESASNSPTSSQLREILHEIILLVGYFALQHEENQDTVGQWGKAPTLLQKLCSLPILYFSDTKCKEILFPTLISVCFDNQRNKSILENEVSTQLIHAYLQQQQQQQQQQETVDPQFLLVARFPPTLLPKALEFFADTN